MSCCRGDRGTSEVTEDTLHGLFLQVTQTKRVPILGYRHQGSCRSGICTLQPLSHPGCFASFCQLYRKYKHALGTFTFTQLFKESVKWITCGTCIYSTKINKTQPQDHFLVFKALTCWWTQPWWKYLLRWQPLPLWALTAPNPTQCQGTYLAANAPWTSHLSSQSGEGDSSTKAALTK